GRQSFDHRVTTSIQRGPHGLIEGVVQGLPDGGTGSFVSSLTLDADGLIRRYVSFYCEPAVPGAWPRQGPGSPRHPVRNPPSAPWSPGGGPRQ
ncbi:MAG TPA: hypothetical protein VFR26_02700, partial [Acidimicrobiales bacterium]|nr:hypothetical protein [Acidimicrobiales bacterium]